MRKPLYTASLAALAAGAIVLAVPGAATAHGSTHGAKHGSAVTVEVVAQGLNNPRGVTIGRHGVIYVAEAGAGGAGPCVTGPEGDPVCFGTSGSVTTVAHGKQRRVVTGLPSLASTDGSQALGVHHLVVGPNGRLVATIGLGAPPAVRDAFGAAGRSLATVSQLPWGRCGGANKLRTIADLAAFEARNNPDQGDPGSELDTNPYGLTWTKKYGYVATDAGGNDVLSIRSNGSGKIKTLAVLHATIVDAPPPPNGPGGQVPMQAVPTSVVQGPDGALYVSQLTGFPFPVGGASVWRIVPGHEPTVYASGFTNLVDLAFDRKGRLYVLSIAKNGLLSGDLTGALIRVNKDGSRTELAAGQLFAPGGMAIGADGSIYVSTFSVAAGAGQLVRIRT